MRWMRDRGPEALTMRYLEAGAGGAVHDGWVDVKTVPYAILAEATAGRYRLGYDGRTTDGPPGTFVVAPPHRRLTFEHYDAADSPMRSRWAHVSFRLWGTIDPWSLLTLPRRIDGAAADVVGECVEGLLRPAPSGHPLREASERLRIGATLFDVLTAASTPAPDALEVAEGAFLLTPLLRRMQDELAEPFDVAGLAKIAMVSESTLHRRFQQIFRLTPMQYLKRLRLDEAARVLARSDIPIAAVVADVGFANPYHFSREFRRCFGMTPSAFRADARKTSGSLTP